MNSGRRQSIKQMSKMGLMAFAAPMINLNEYQLFPFQDRKYSKRAIDLIAESTVLDMLSPLTLNATQLFNLILRPGRFEVGDLEKYKDAGIDVYHFAVGFGGPNAYTDLLKYFASLNAFIANNGDHLMRVDSIADIEAVGKSPKTGVLLGVQNAEHFRTPDDVDDFYGLGQRISQLTYNTRNRIGSGCTERGDGGISDFGVSIIEKMNAVGMAVDVSHCGPETTMNAFEISKKPVLVTHSNAKALNDHVRCKSDEALKAMAKSGGVIGITGMRNFVKATEPTTIQDVLNHFDYVAKLVGIEFVGVGSDIDLYGYDALPQEELERLRAGRDNDKYKSRERSDIEGLDHPKRMFDLTEGLISRGYSDANIKDILGGNFKRALSEIWIS